MYLFRDEAKALMRSLRSEMLGTLSSKFDFLKSLLNEDDWSFAVKLHALIETVTTQLIISSINDERVRSVIERLPLSDDELGKLRIAKDLGLYTSRQRAFVRRLSTVRNNVVHNVENLNFTFSAYVSRLDTNAKKSWQDAVCWFQDGKDPSDYWRKASLEQPKLAVWFSGFMFVSLSLVDENEARGRRRIREAAAITSANLLAGFIDDLSPRMC